MAEMPGFSPPMRGCSYGAQRRTVAAALFPAHAGVILTWWP